MNLKTKRSEPFEYNREKVKRKGSYNENRLSPRTPIIEERQLSRDREMSREKPKRKERHSSEDRGRLRYPDNDLANELLRLEERVLKY